MPFGFRLACAILLARCAFAEVPALVPVRWEAARYYQAWSLDLLRDTPVNCVLVTWGVGEDGSGRRNLVRDYARQAHQRGVQVMAIVPAGSAAGPYAASAKEAGLDGLAIEDESTEEIRPDDSLGLPVVRYPVKAGNAPGVRISKDGAVQATPTSEPWIDSNFWLVRLLKERGRKPAWLGYRLEAPGETDYVRAIAEAAAAGGRWIFTPDDHLMAGLESHQPEAERCWRHAMAALRFFEEEGQWREFRPAGPLGIVAVDSAMGAEYLNLIARRRIPYRLLERPALSGAGLAGLQAVLAAGFDLSQEECRVLRRFAEEGGLTIVAPGCGEAKDKGEDPAVKAAGKGRMAAYRETEPDPESLSKDVLHLMGKDNLGIRIFHGVTVLPVESESPDGRFLSIGLVNYASEPADAVMVRLAGEYRRARLYQLDGAPVDLEMEKADRGTEVKIASVPVFAALVLEK